MPNCQSNLDIAFDALSLSFCIFINTTVYHGAPRLSRTFYSLDKILGPGVGFTDKLATAVDSSKKIYSTGFGASYSTPKIFFHPF